MASAGSGNVVKIALVGAGGFLLYRLLSGSGGGISLANLGTALSSSTGSTGPAAPAPAAKPAAIAPLSEQELLTAAGKTSTDLYTQDQWNFYRNQLRPPELTGAQFAAVFPGDTVQMTAAEFLAKMKAAGFAGLGAVLIPVPMVQTINGRQTIVWGAREAGRSPSSPRRMTFPRGPF